MLNKKIISLKLVITDPDGPRPSTSSQRNNQGLKRAISETKQDEWRNSWLACRINQEDNFLCIERVFLSFTQYSIFNLCQGPQSKVYSKQHQGPVYCARKLLRHYTLCFIVKRDWVIKLCFYINNKIASGRCDGKFSGKIHWDWLKYVNVNGLYIKKTTTIMRTVEWLSQTDADYGRRKKIKNK